MLQAPHVLGLEKTGLHSVPWHAGVGRLHLIRTNMIPWTAAQVRKVFIATFFRVKDLCVG